MPIFLTFYYCFFGQNRLYYIKAGKIAVSKIKNMQYIVSTTWSAVAPMLELTAVRSWARFVDQNFTIISTFMTLFSALVMWANI